jgi:hypothetical protein
MMSFFYTTDAGAIDFIALILVAGLGLLFGSQRIRSLATISLCVFFLNRLYIAGLSELSVSAALAVTEFIAFLSVIFGLGKPFDRISKSFAALSGPWPLLQPLFCTGNFC